MKEVVVYIAGKVSPQSVFGTHDWRDNFCNQLASKIGRSIRNLDPTKSNQEFSLPENDPHFIFGRDCFMIKKADVVVVHLTDDISVGGSQEMLIAKYFNKPLVGIAPKGGKFHKEEKIIQGKPYKNWKHAFVAVPCDAMVQDIDELAQWMNEHLQNPKQSKNLSILDETLEYYEKEFHQDDTYLH